MKVNLQMTKVFGSCTRNIRLTNSVSTQWRKGKKVSGVFWKRIKSSLRRGRRKRLQNLSRADRTEDLFDKSMGRILNRRFDSMQVLTKQLRSMINGHGNSAKWTLVEPTVLNGKEIVPRSTYNGQTAVLHYRSI